jgi:hypothetical protein
MLMYYQQMCFVHMNDSILYLILIHEKDFVLRVYQEEYDRFDCDEYRRIFFEIFYKEYFQFVQFVYSIDSLLKQDTMHDEIELDQM